MNILKYFKQSFQRKRARRIRQEYPAKVSTFVLEREGQIDFANWDNPLVSPVEITQAKVDFYKRFIKEGDLAIDIGANIGDTTVPMALAAGKSGTVLGFDPNPYVYKILKKNASLNEDKVNIIPLCYAITVKEEEFYYISSEASFCNGGISPTKESRHGKYIYEEKIKGINLDQFLEQHYAFMLPKLSLIKIDTEGYDKEIIKSISDLISKYKPAIIAECFKNFTDNEKLELFDVITKLGYEIYYFEDFVAETQIIKLTERKDITKWNKGIDIYALPI